MMTVITQRLRSLSLTGNSSQILSKRRLSLNNEIISFTNPFYEHQENELAACSTLPMVDHQTSFHRDSSHFTINTIESNDSVDTIDNIDLNVGQNSSTSNNRYLFQINENLSDIERQNFHPHVTPSIEQHNSYTTGLFSPLNGDDCERINFNSIQTSSIEKIDHNEIERIVLNDEKPKRRLSAASIRRASLKFAANLFNFDANNNNATGDDGGKDFKFDDGVVKIETFEPLEVSSEPFQESPYDALKQIILPFLIAGLGNVAAGVLFASVQRWTVFKSISQLNILVTPLLGLKGNVEMTLASRLSTHSNLGHMDNPPDRNRIIIGNMSLVQCQATVVGFIAPIFAILLSTFSSDTDAGSITFTESTLLTASAVITANVANLLLGSMMFVVIILARKFNINPDNIATPIAASCGDFTTLLTLAYVSHYLFNNMSTPWIQNSLLIFLLLLIPFWAYISWRILFTRKILIGGWFPILGAMILQSTGGLIMDHSLKRFTRVAAFQPVINGIAGNLVSIQTSRMSTYLHKCSRPKFLPLGDSKICHFIFFGKKSAHSRMSQLLLLLSVPSHMLFLVIIYFVRKHFILTPIFTVCYLTAAFFQVALLLSLSYLLVNFLWKKGFDPDTFAIPFLTAFADLIGSVMLATAFVVLLSLKDVNAYEGLQKNVHNGAVGKLLDPIINSTVHNLIN